MRCSDQYSVFSIQSSLTLDSEEEERYSVFSIPSHFSNHWTARRRRGEMFRSVFNLPLHWTLDIGREVFNIQYSLTLVQSLDSKEEER